MRQQLHPLHKLAFVAGMAASASLSTFGQVLDLPDGLSPKVRSGNSIGMGPAQTPDDLQIQATGLGFYTANYAALRGLQLPFNILGTDPSLGAGTTTIPTTIVPLKFIFAAAGNTAIDGTNVVTAVINSPIFQTADYTVGGTDLGVTQYGDAIQRAEFWNLPGFSRDYHVLLGMPAIAPTATFTVPVGKGNVYRIRSNGVLVGVLDETYFNQVLATLVPSYAANQLPIYLTDNVFLGTNGLIQNCCTLGFHSSQRPPLATAKTWIYAAYTEPGLFNTDALIDVVPLSHEVAEWLNDPFVASFATVNLIPPTLLPGQGGACIFNFETGDPLEAPIVSFAKVTNGTTYHLQDEVLLPWYLHTAPSFSVNGWYTFLNTFTSFGDLCGPG